MKQYHDLCKRVLDEGAVKPNRTGVPTIGIFGAQMEFDLQQGFPAVTTKKLAFHSVAAELVGFLRAYREASLFRQLGTTIWDANANKNETWLNNPKRAGQDDLGLIYGVQWRQWLSGAGMVIDQLKPIVDKLRAKNCWDRRLVVTAWNPGELDAMALPPCHMIYQFQVEPNHLGEPTFLNCAMTQRSCDLFLGVPFNIASYALLTHVIAAMTGLQPGTFVHHLNDVHIYDNHLCQVHEMLSRQPYPLPELAYLPNKVYLEDYEPNDFQLINYKHHDPIKARMAI